MITIEELLEILKKDKIRVSKFVNNEMYDGDGNRDTFQEGWTLGKEMTLEQVIKLIENGIWYGERVSKNMDNNEKAIAYAEMHEIERGIAYQDKPEKLDWLIRQQD